jgi:hypothetical protein
LQKANKISFIFVYARKNKENEIVVVADIIFIHQNQQNSQIEAKKNY